MKKLIVAVDGPSGAGKSTVSKAIAERLGLTYIDTGAMYRAVAVKSLEEGTDTGDSKAMEEIAKDVGISFRWIEGKNHTFLDGRDVSDEIRTAEISLLTSRVSSLPAVRREMVRMQREIGRQGGVIMDGRDIGTVVFPDAGFKFFLDARLKERGRRRHLEMASKASGRKDVKTTTEEMAERDRADSERAEAPLRMADDAIRVDTTDLSIDEVVEIMENIILDRREEA